MRVGLDMDGCIYPFIEDMRFAFLARGRELGQLPDPRRWETWLEWGVSREEWDETVAQEVLHGRLFQQGRPFDGARKAIDRLYAAGHSVHIITDRASQGPTAVSATAWWLDNWGIRYDSLTLSKDKRAVAVDVYVDDHLDNYYAVDERCESWLMSRPWNEYEVAGGPQPRRLHSWSELPEIVERHSRGDSRSESIFNEAERLVRGDRGAQYGEAGADFARTGRIWGALLDRWRRTDDPSIPAWLVALMMTTLKLSREVHRRKRDNRVDAAGYLLCEDDIVSHNAPPVTD